MVKARLTLPDVIALVRDLRPVLLGAQVANIYDIDNKTYEFKLTLPSSVPPAAVAAVTGDTASGDSGGRVNLVMESGVRFHTSRFTRPHASDAGNLPSGFTMKLRKHLRNRRLSGAHACSTCIFRCYFHV
jgi:predicted ribosome quality control (RQC) complex YloA/Tae2 family protein